jgi:hypothetical protein
MSNRKKVKPSLFEEVSEEESAKRFRARCERMKSTGGYIEPLSSDPWAWQIETDDEYLDLHISGGSVAATQYEAVKAVKRLKDRIEANTDESGFYVLYCVGLCAESGLVLPRWLASVFSHRFNAVTSFDENSWDSKGAFGTPYPANTNLAAMKRLKRQSCQVWSEINDCVKAGGSVTKGLFDAVGSPLGLSATSAEKYYYFAIQSLGLHNPIEVKGTKHADTADLFSAASITSILGKDNMPLVGGGLLSNGNSRVFDSLKFVKESQSFSRKSGITSKREKGSMKSSTTCEDANEPKPTQAISKPKRAIAKTPTGGSARRAS